MGATATSEQVRKWGWRIGGGAILLMLGVGLGATGAQDTTSAPATGIDHPANSTPTKATDTPEPVETDAYEPTVEDFTLTMQVLEKQCFGSAGCNVTFRVEAAYGGQPLDPDNTYELIYDVEGGDDAYTNRITIQGDQYEQQPDDMIGTPSENTELTAVVTSISKRGSGS